MTEKLSPSNHDELTPLSVCPYKGLSSYTEADGEYFFGRDLDRDLVIANLMANRLTVLYGPSGVGKSSLLQAGVISHLRQMPEDAFSYLAVQNAVVVYHSSWHGDSLIELGSALLNAIPNQHGIEDLLLKQPSLSVELLHDLTERLNADIYLLLDQFEEQTLYQTGLEGETFLDELGHIVTRPGLRTSVLLGIREDSLAKLDRLEAHVPGLSENKLRLHHLNRAAAREAIEGPLTRYNVVVPSTQQVAIELELIEDILQQVRTGSLSVGDAGQGGVGASSESIETPFLQLVMTRLWAEERKSGSVVLHRETLAGLGGADRIVRTHLDAVMSELTRQERNLAADIFRYLVTPSGTKISLTAEDLAYYPGVPDADAVRKVLERLASGHERVLRPVPPPVGTTEAPRYEIFHDRMAPAVLDWRRRYVGERQRSATAQVAASATAVLILGLASLVAFPIVGVAAIVLGHRVLKTIDTQPTEYSGRRRVKLGVILGWVGTVLMTVFYVFIFIGTSSP